VITKQLMPDISDDDGYDEEWLVKVNTGGEYRLDRIGANILQEAMSQGQRQVIFESYTLMIPYIAEFYRIRRFVKGQLQLPAQATERPMTEEELKKARIKLDEIRARLKNMPR
jgi:hypothetical protein